MPRLYLLVLLASASWLASSCIVQDNHSSCVTSECYDVCELYCDAWGYCWEECYTECYCVEEVVYVACYSNRDCYQNESCINGDCVANAPNPNPTRGTRALCEPCSAHEDCAESDALCLQLFDSTEMVCGRACVNDNSCPSGYVCAELTDREGSQCIPATNSCQSPPGTCRAHADCTDGQRCQDGACVDAPAPGTCEAAADCETGQRCLDNTCVPGCNSSVDCSGATVCSNGICTPSDRVQCRFSADCAEAKTCVDATCLDSCSDTEPCAQGFVCQSGFCFEEPEGGMPPSSCAASCECPSGLSCDTETSTCVERPAPEACAVSCDCPSGQTCVEGQCQP